ncbi:HAD-like protein [Myriangium duriaei CBS 260.36]|uniref:HAD-like protein n=1 Tax=Myriangium duriaei CBS 260.36 TaxID=1168546 RepID=A0A9P4MEK3_9PEZI|nr:HAD-like protein [Myriangium duriaei CBS 260.36]
MPTSFSPYKCLTFDCYGTLVDWEGGIYTALQPIISQLPSSHPLHNNRLRALKEFVHHEGIVQRAHPAKLYRDILALAFNAFAAEQGVTTTPEQDTRFGASVKDWPVFPDTISALQRLKKHFKLVILSNVDIDSFKGTLAGPLAGVDFDAIYTAQEIGSYKPDLNNFRYLIQHCREDLGVEKGEIIHTAQSLFHDTVPATLIGLTSAWIERGEDCESVMGGNLADLGEKVNIEWQFRNMGAMADAVDASEGK